MCDDRVTDTCISACDPFTPKGSFTYKIMPMVLITITARKKCIFDFFGCKEREYVMHIFKYYIINFILKNITYFSSVFSFLEDWFMKDVSVAASTKDRQTPAFCILHAAKRWNKKKTTRKWWKTSFSTFNFLAEESKAFQLVTGFGWLISIQRSSLRSYTN